MTTPSQPLSGQRKVANIGALGARRRAVGGIVWVVLTLIAFAAMVVLGEPKPMRLVLVLPIFAAGIGLFQARARTCVVLGALGKREADVGDVTLAPEERPIVGRQMFGVVGQSAVVAVVATLLLYLL